MERVNQIAERRVILFLKHSPSFADEGGPSLKTMLRIIRHSPICLRPQSRRRCACGNEAGNGSPACRFETMASSSGPSQMDAPSQ